MTEAFVQVEWNVTVIFLSDSFLYPQLHLVSKIRYNFLMVFQKTILHFGHQMEQTAGIKKWL